MTHVLQRYFSRIVFDEVLQQSLPQPQDHLVITSDSGECIPLSAPGQPHWTRRIRGQEVPVCLLCLWLTEWETQAFNSVGERELHVGSLCGRHQSL